MSPDHGNYFTNCTYVVLAGTVECDEGCGALENPETVEELKAAVDHWRGHHYRNGCTHGC